MTGRAVTGRFVTGRSVTGRAGQVLLVLAALVALTGLAAGPAPAAAPPQPAAAAAQPAAAAAPGAAAGPVVVVGVPGLAWPGVRADSTPALHDLVGRGAAGALSVRSAGAATCPADGWLSLGAGDRAQGRPAGAEGCSVDPTAGDVRGSPGGGAVVPALPALVAANAELGYRATLGLLADSVRGSGGCVAAVGPGAALAAADRDGRVDAYRPDLGEPGTEALPGCPVVLVEAPADPAAADALLARVDAARPPGSTLLVVGVGATPGTATPRDTLQVAVEVGPEAEPGRALVSPSTRRAPYVQLIDVAPTVLARLGAAPEALAAGQPWRSTGEPAAAAARIADLVDVTRLADAHRRLAVPAAATLAAVPALLLAAAALAGRRHAGPGRTGPGRTGTTGDRGGPRRVAEVVAVAAGAVPAATYLATLVPWWRAPLPLAALLGAVAVPAVLLAALALVGPWRHRPFGPAGVVAAATVAVLAVDVVTGSRLQMSSVLGHSPLVAGRFSGFSNLAFGVLAAAVLLSGAAAAAALRGRSARARGLAVAAVVAVGVVVDGTPGWGSDVGGVLALVPAGVLLGLLATGARVSWRRLLAAAATGAAVVALLATADALRPAEAQSHLGRFALQVVRGEAGPVLVRKASANLALLTDNPATAAVPVLLVAVAALVLRPGRVGAAGLARAYGAVPELRAGLVAVLAGATLGALTNDSGVAVPAAAFLVAGPLALATALRADCPASRGGAREWAAAAPDGPPAGQVRLPGGRDPAVTLDPRGQAG